ncbi:hypothetical protein IWZ03DRAFT_368827 [Phyllosticta citriasiana]|uniref:Transmembrane protein n=1 Tax=Phyllosticta citriasiana TaxID=595635 RepID=A0ABR1KTY0_9PEZI
MPTVALPPRELTAGWKTFTRSSPSASPIALAITRSFGTYTTTILRDSSAPATTSAAAVKSTQNSHSAGHPSRTGIVVAVLFSVLALFSIIVLLFYCCRQPRHPPKSWCESNSPSPPSSPLPDPVLPPAPPVRHSPRAAETSGRNDAGSAQSGGATQPPRRPNQNGGPRPTEGSSIAISPPLPAGQPNSPLSRSSHHPEPLVTPTPNPPAHGRSATTVQGETSRPRATTASFGRSPPASNRHSHAQEIRPVPTTAPVLPSHEASASNRGVASRQTHSDSHTAAPTATRTPRASNHGTNTGNIPALPELPVGNQQDDLVPPQAPAVPRPVPPKSESGGRHGNNTNGHSDKAVVQDGEMQADEGRPQAHPAEKEVLVVEKPSSSSPEKPDPQKPGPISATPPTRKSEQSSPARSEGSARKRDEQLRVPRPEETRDMSKATASVQGSSPRSPSSAQSKRSSRSKSSHGSKNTARSQSSSESKKSVENNAQKSATASPQNPSRAPSIRSEGSEAREAPALASPPREHPGPTHAARSQSSSRSRSSRTKSTNEEPQEQTYAPIHQSPEAMSPMASPARSVDSTGRVFVTAPEVPEAHERAAHRRKVIKFKLDERAPQSRAGRSLWTIPNLEIEDRSGYHFSRPVPGRKKKKRAKRQNRPAGLDADVGDDHVPDLDDEEMFAKLDRLNFLAGRTGGRFL